MRTRGRIFAISVLVVVVAFAELLVCAKPAATQEAVIKAGMTTPLTGPGGPWGIAMEQGVRIAFSKFNEQGGVTINGVRYKLDLTVYDDAFTVEKVIANVRKLIQVEKAKFLFILGGVPLKAAMPLVMENKVITFGYSWLKPEPDQVDVFWVAPIPDDFSQIYLWVAKNRPTVKKVAFLGQNNEVGLWSREAGERIAKGAGLNVVAVEHFDPKATDFTPYLRKILAQNPDSLDTCGTGTGQNALIVKQARELGYKGYFIDASDNDFHSAAKIAGEENFQGYIGTGAGDEPLPEAWADFKKRSIAAYGQPFNPASITRSFGAWALTNAIAGAKTLDRDSLIKYMEKMEWQGLNGKTYFFGQKKYGLNHMITSPLPICEYRAGVARIIGWTETQKWE